MSIDESTIKEYTREAEKVAKRIEGQFVDTSALLGIALDSTIGCDGLTLSNEGKLQFQKERKGERWVRVCLNFKLKIS